MIYIEEREPIKIPGETSFFVKFNYSPLLVDIIKQCTPTNYDKKTNLWEIPIVRLSKFINQASIFDEIQLNVLQDKKELNPFNIELNKHKTKIYEHQKEAIQYGLTHNKWLLLDKPGLGKTLTAIYIAEELKKRNNLEHCLIICGVNTLKINWENEIKRHSNLSCRIIGKRTSSTGRVYYDTIENRIKELKTKLKEFFIIINIESLRSDKILKELNSNTNKFDMIVLDEAHVCKSPTSEQGRNLLKLKNASYKIALSGTLILNSPLDTYVPLKWIEKEHSNYTNFKSQYCIYGGYFNNEITGYKNIDYLEQQIQNCSLRRTKELLNLPEKNIVNEILDMNEKEAIFYQNIANGILEQVDKIEMSTINLLSMITRLRQVTSCPSLLTSEDISSTKLQRTQELIEEITSNGDKVVVFSLFKEPLNQLYNKLTKYKPLLCTGDISDIDISKNINLFQTNSEYKVILCTHSKMGTGVTLNAASYSIFIDSPWTAGMSEQSEDRIHRIGSKKPVFIYKLYCNNTFDMRVKEIVENKQALGDYLIDNKRDQKTLEVLKKLLTKENLY